MMKNPIIKIIDLIIILYILIKISNLIGIEMTQEYKYKVSQFIDDETDNYSVLVERKEIINSIEEDISFIYNEKQTAKLVERYKKDIVERIQEKLDLEDPHPLKIFGFKNKKRELYLELLKTKVQVDYI